MAIADIPHYLKMGVFKKLYTCMHICNFCMYHLACSIHVYVSTDTNYYTDVKTFKKKLNCFSKCTLWAWVNYRPTTIDMQDIDLDVEFA